MHRPFVQAAGSVQLIIIMLELFVQAADSVQIIYIMLILSAQDADSVQLINYNARSLCPGCRQCAVKY